MRLAIDVIRCMAGVAVLSASAGLMAAEAKASDTRAIDQAMALEASTLVAVDAPFVPGERIVTSVRVHEETWTFDLRPHSVRAEDYRIWHSDGDGNLTPVEPGPINTLRGTILERPGAFVAASIIDGGLFASIRLDGILLWLEPVGRRVAGFTDRDYVLYDNDDIIPNAGQCGTNEAMIVARDGGLGEVGTIDSAPGASATDAPASDGQATYYAELACDADYPYYVEWGATTESRINAVINQVNVQYDDEVDISHFITEIIVRTDFVYSSNNASTLLSQFRNRWLQFHGGIQRDVAHLFTGRNLSGGTIGIAWTIGGICTSSAYCLAESDCCGSFGCATDLTAHELGHLWNGSHCSCTNPEYTMNPFILCANTFHPSQTRPDIIAHRNSRSCLDFDPPAQIGACCFPTGDCLPASNANCTGSGGIYLGDGTVCSGSCPDPVGACCFPIGDCAVVTEADCLDTGGTYGGNGYACEDQDCAQPPFGACCFPDGSCAVVANIVCFEAGGGYIGDDSDCAGVVCPDPIGNCCLDDGSCFEVEESICAILGGLFGGDDTSCGQVECAGAPTCPADLDGDLTVGFTDLVTLLSLWGPCPGCPADLDGDDMIGFTDLVFMLSNWGDCA